MNDEFLPEMKSWKTPRLTLTVPEPPVENGLKRVTTPILIPLGENEIEDAVWISEREPTAAAITTLSHVDPPAGAKASEPTVVDERIVFPIEGENPNDEVERPAMPMPIAMAIP